MKYYFKKTNGGLAYADEVTAEAMEKYKNGRLLLCEIVAPRNAPFHEKFFALLRVGFKYWEPGEVTNRHGKPQKSFRQYRKDVIILAGFFEVVLRLDGSSKIEAKSISFANMDQDAFSELYSKVINVLLERVFIGYKDTDVVHMAEQMILSFA